MIVTGNRNACLPYEWRVCITIISRHDARPDCLPSLSGDAKFSLQQSFQLCVVVQKWPASTMLLKGLQDYVEISAVEFTVLDIVFISCPARYATCDW